MFFLRTIFLFFQSEARSLKTVAIVVMTEIRLREMDFILFKFMVYVSGHILTDNLICYCGKKIDFRKQ